MEQKTINVFLASPGELKEDRVSFRSFVSEIDETFQKMGRPLKTRMWEGLDASYKGHPEQDEYDRLVRASDMFLALFHTVGGKITIHEFNVALKEFNKNKQTPKIYVYMKALQEGEKIDSKLEKFQKRLENKKMRLYWTTYSSQDSLHLHFLQQLLIVYADGLSNLKVEDGTVKLGNMPDAEMSNLSFASGYNDYQRISAELNILPNEIDSARKFLEEHPDNEYLQGELQKKLDRYNNLKEEFSRLQQALFETSQRIATMQRENLSDKLRCATDAFVSGDMERANTLLDEIAIEAEIQYSNQKRELVHQDIEAFLLQAKTKMVEVNIPIEERIKEVHSIYTKADQWAKDSALPDDKLDGLLKDYSQFLYDYGMYNEAEPVYLRLVSLREATLGKEHPDTATTYSAIGQVYDNLGNYPKAFEYYQKALDIREKMLGKEHPDTATTYNNIARIYHSQGDYTKALEYYFMALDIREKVLGKEHPDTATSYNNIGAVYDSQGNYTKALEYYFKDLAISEKVLGKEHPSTATSYNNIGLTYDNLGEYTKALEYYFKALDIREKVLGKEHPDTASSYNNIGVFYDSQGDYTKALEYYFKALDILEKVLGPDHPNTKTVKKNMIICQLMKAKQAGALEDER